LLASQETSELAEPDLLNSRLRRSLESADWQTLMQ